MANPQPSRFVRLSQELLEALYRTNFTGPEWQVLMFIIRLTYGFSRKKVDLQIKHFSRGFGHEKRSVPGTKLDRRVIHRAVNNLLIKNVIIIEPNELCKTANYSLQKDYDSWHSTYEQKTSQMKDSRRLSQIKDSSVTNEGQKVPKTSQMKDTLYKKDMKDNDKQESGGVNNSQKLKATTLADHIYSNSNTGETITQIVDKIKTGQY